MATVQALFRKVAFGQPMQPASSLSIIPEAGVAGDINAIPYSPRQVLIVSAEVIESFNLRPGDLRENIVIRGLNVDNLPSGTVLQFGRSARIRLTFSCEPCKRISGLFRAPVSIIAGRRGMLGAVVAAGEFAVSDSVTLTDEVFPLVPESKFERFAWILRRIPPGAVVTFSQIGVLLGVPSQYLRVIPKFMKRAAMMGLPAHRVVTSDSRISGHLIDQTTALQREGVHIRGGHSVDERHHWVNSGRPYLHAAC